MSEFYVSCLACNCVVFEQRRVQVIERVVIEQCLYSCGEIDHEDADYRTVPFSFLRDIDGYLLPPHKIAVSDTLWRRREEQKWRLHKENDPWV
ncbi:hypothetical protein QCN27_19930 [Cereibacter sp. SYSU M97828]|nr:hypothetical protein [Cereibacter flavus]